MSAVILKFPRHIRYEVSVERVTHEHADGSETVSIEVARAPLHQDWFDFFGPFANDDEARSFAVEFVRANSGHRLVGGVS